MSDTSNRIFYCLYLLFKLSLMNKMLKIGGYINILIAILHIVGLFWAQQMYDYTGVGDRMRENAAIHPSLPYVITIIVSIAFFVFGLYGLLGAGVIKKMPLLKTGVFVIATIYLLRGFIGTIINLFVESPFLIHHLIFSIFALLIGLLYLIGGLKQ